MTHNITDLSRIYVRGIELKKVIDVRSGYVIWIPHGYKYKMYSTPDRYANYIYGG